jgi:antitoxin component of MazEF toxin-antitoxin module
MWIRRLFKQGSSVCVVVPREVCIALGLAAGSYVELELTKARNVVLKEVKRGEGHWHRLREI